MTDRFLWVTCGEALITGLDGRVPSAVDRPISRLQENWGDRLNVARAREGDEEVEEQMLAVLKHLRAVVVHACLKLNIFQKVFSTPSEGSQRE